MNALNWDLMFSNNTGGGISKLAAYQTVAWVRRAVDVRANALSAIPFKVYGKRGKDVTDSWPMSNSISTLLWRLEAGLQIYGAGYLAVNKNIVGIDREFAWLLPSSITPKYDSKVGITGFERRVKGTVIPLDAEDLIYIWQPNLEAELGPGIGWVQTVLAEAGMAKSANEFAQQFFERGAVPALILSVDGNPKPDELDKLESWWRHLLAGVKRAWETVALRATVKPITIGYPTKDLAMPELMQLVRNQIAVASGVPQTMFEDAAQVATRVAEDRQSFYMETIVPEAQLIENALNKQYFDKQGWRCELDYNALDIFQEDEASRADALTKYTLAGFPLLMACEVLGIDLTDEQKLALAAQERKPEPAPVVEAVEQEPPREVEEMPADAVRAELATWRRYAEKHGARKAVDFKAHEIDAATAETIRDGLLLLDEAEHVRDAFVLKAKASRRTRRGEVDPNEAGKDAWETVLQAKIRRLLIAQQSRVLARMFPAEKDAPIRVDTDDSFWDDEIGAWFKALFGDVYEMMQDAATAMLARMPVGVDWTLVAERAAEFAHEYTYELVKGIVAKTRDVVSQAVERFIRTPGETRETMEAALRPFFGDVRASRIAVTETTRAYAEGEKRVVQVAKDAGYNMRKRWNTNEDELVCPECAALDGKDPGDSDPPLHPNCRCWITHEWVK
jgi:HK97 family phage portal protein